MISEKEAQDLMEKFIALRSEYEISNSTEDLKVLKEHEQICITKFRYLVSMKTSRYKGFPNYEDLNQEGMEVLLRAMKNYNPAKGIFFYWAHKYIGTRISRSANLHTAIRYPLKYAKSNPPHRENALPLMVDNKSRPDKSFEKVEVSYAVQDAMKHLNQTQCNIINLAFGFDGDKPLSINKICKKMKMSRISCIKTINTALGLLKQNIQL